jgi:ElaB/YqjD/DUF883 family membrane-anchored ribosome-binding protein
MKTNNNMQDHVDSITDDARSLIAAAADVTDEKVVEARNRLSTALNSAKDTYVKVQKKAVEGAKVADHVIRERPYQTMAVAFGVGALVGFLLSRRNK